MVCVTKAAVALSEHTRAFDRGAPAGNSRLWFASPETSKCLSLKQSVLLLRPQENAGLMASEAAAAVMRQKHAILQVGEEGWHIPCERGCTRDDYGKAGPFSAKRLEMDLPFVNILCVLVCTHEHARRRGEERRERRRAERRGEQRAEQRAESREESREQRGTLSQPRAVQATHRETAGQKAMAMAHAAEADREVQALRGHVSRERRAALPFLVLPLPFCQRLMPLLAARLA